eukprot:CAMPEP_0196750624 /NCGR_PEP_ID=MMETSP1091-20130531/81055_1 /TAXON_ID=302021 /ORGANISM="Rhodomonas sp., Strain CCMP768" /LENGTH=218 /DNA_ID=CAMNT_0042098261 /DNA_START=223 /DNA_END=876 /DNA_ORIENTATION=+
MDVQDSRAKTDQRLTDLKGCLASLRSVLGREEQRRKGNDHARSDHPATNEGPGHASAARAVGAKSMVNASRNEEQQKNLVLRTPQKEEKGKERQESAPSQLSNQEEEEKSRDGSDETVSCLQFAKRLQRLLPASAPQSQSPDHEAYLQIFAAQTPPPRRSGRALLLFLADVTDETLKAHAATAGEALVTAVTLVRDTAQMVMSIDYEDKEVLGVLLSD